MSEDQPRTGPDDPRDTSEQIREGERPTTNQPLNAAPRPRVAPALLVVLILAAVVVIILALTLL
jgi:cell division septal protein FtsQ